MENKMNSSELLIKVCEAIEYEGEIIPSDNLLNLDGWDSLGMLSVIAMLDAQGIKVDLQRLQIISTVADLINLCGVIDD
jgi:acyl carrier protein